jgi:hypothetical protein
MECPRTQPVPTVSLAAAVIVILTGGVGAAPLAGAARLTTGAASTVIATGLEVLALPASLVARTLST